MAGPNPTFASCWTQAGNAFQPVDELEQFGNSNSPNFLDLQDDAIGGTDGEYTPEALGILNEMRSQIAQPLSQGSLAGLWRPFLQEMLRKLGNPAVESNNDELMLAEIRQYMVDNSQTINRRDLTFATPTADGGNTGDGVLNRLTVDKDGHTLDNTAVELKTITIQKDHNSGARKHAEELLFEGTGPDRTGLQWVGNGDRKTFNAIHALSGQIVRNPSFETNGVSADDTAPPTITSIQNWTILSGLTTNLKLRSAAGFTYRGYPGQPTTLYGLEFEGNETISQNISAVSPGRGFTPGVPYYCQIAVCRKASATGNVVLHLGSQTATVSLASLTNDVWSILRIAIGTKNYHQNFNETDLDIKVVVDTLATGTVVVDDLIIAPFVKLDGTWYAPVGGATAWLKDDFYTHTDLIGGARGKFA